LILTTIIPIDLQDFPLTRAIGHTFRIYVGFSFHLIDKIKLFNTKSCFDFRGLLQLIHFRNFAHFDIVLELIDIFLISSINTEPTAFLDPLLESSPKLTLVISRSAWLECCAETQIRTKTLLLTKAVMLLSSELLV